MITNKKNILFINGHLNVGGVERSLVDVLKHFNYNKYNVDLLLLEGLGDYLAEIPKNVNIINKDTRPAFGPIATSIKQNLRTRNLFAIKYRIILILTNVIGKKAFKLLPKLLNINKDYDVVIAYRTGIVADIVAYGVNVKTKLCWWHHGCIKENDNLSQLTKFNAVIAVSNGIRDLLRYNQFETEILVIPNIVDIKNICSKASNEPNPFNNFDGLKFITVGRIVEEKHVENVVEAAIQLKADDKLKFKWYIIGDGELYDYIKGLILEANIEDIVILCGSKSNPYPYIKHADFMVHTSHIESQGLVIQEAMALGTPCVVTRSVGPSEFIIEGENGIMVEPTIDSLIGGIYQLAEDKSLQVKIANNGISTISQKYSPETIIKQIEEFINHEY